MEVGASLLQTSRGCRSGTAFPVARNHTPRCNVESFIYCLMWCSFVLLVWQNISRNNFRLELVSLASDRLQREPLVHQANVESLLEGPVFLHRLRYENAWTGELFSWHLIRLHDICIFTFTNPNRARLLYRICRINGLRQLFQVASVKSESAVCNVLAFSLYSEGSASFSTPLHF